MPRRNIEDQRTQDYLAWVVGNAVTLGRKQLQALPSCKRTAELDRGMERLLKETCPNYTCRSCGLADSCEYAFEYYNTDGDCLAEK